MRKLLLTAFEPFGGSRLNASQEVARALKNHPFQGVQVEVLELPVVRCLAPELALAAIARLKPDIIVLLGEAGGRATITPERVALNLDEFPIPDNAGNWPREEAIVAGGPAAYFSSLPLVAMRAALEQEDIPAAISNTAGTYVCNHLFYHVMHHLSETGSLSPTGSPTQAGFLHIPAFSEERPRGVRDWPSLLREVVVRGVRIALETCVQENGSC